ncbi:MAG: RnfABCDGE type electron transport complex subunit D [Oscillospiraceae bacterium]|nr:RnfABCDGE type electron transport complex subunit D [Oscillospiraceae bacterium]
MNERLNKDNSYSADIIITLLAILLMSCLYHGARSLIVCLISCLSCYFFELIALKLQNKKIAFHDYSAVITGLIIGLMMPATIKYSILVVISFVAMIVGKHVFGTSGFEIFNPAAVAYVFAALCWPLQVLSYPVTTTKLSIANYVDVTKVSSFSSQFNAGQALPSLNIETLLGYFDGPIGCTQMFVIFVCAIVLILRRSVSISAFLGFVGTYMVVCYLIPFETNIDITDYLFYELTTNMLLFAALFIVSDYRFLPTGSLNRFIIGALTALLTLLFRRVGNAENAVMFAVLIANPFVDVVDNYHTRLVAFIRGNEGDDNNDLFSYVLRFITGFGAAFALVFVKIKDFFIGLFKKERPSAVEVRDTDEEE